MREAASPEATGCILGGTWRSRVRSSSCPTNRGVFFEPARGSDEGCQPAFRVGPTVGPLSVSDRSKCYLALLKMPRKLLTLRSLQTCQGSGVGSIPIGRSIKIKQLRERLIFHIFQKYNLIANLGGKFGLYVLKWNLPGVKRRHSSGRMPPYAPSAGEGRRG